VLLFVGPVFALITMVCPIPSPPYNPKSPEEDIIKVEAYIEPPKSPPGGTSGYTLHVIVTFAAATPPTGQAIIILVTELQGSTETGIGCDAMASPSKTIHEVSVNSVSSTPNIAVYAWLATVTTLDTAGTDRAPNNGEYSITSLSAAAPNQFYDPEGAVGGVVLPTSKLEVVAPFAALIVAVSAVVAVKRRRA
jgi:hypothetical protein